MSQKQYDKGVDYALLEQNGIAVVKYQPWQLGLFHKDLVGKFVWYPKKGTLMYQITSPDDIVRGVKIGESGDFMAKSIDLLSSENVTQKVIDEVLKKIQ